MIFQKFMKCLINMPEKDKKNKSEIYNKLKDKSELAYDDISDLVEYLIVTNVKKYTFDGFTEDDIAQEIRTKCFKLLTKWNNKRSTGNPIWFFAVAIRNYLYNLRRNHSRKNPNYNPKDKFHTPSMFCLDSENIEFAEIFQDNEYDLLNEEIINKLTIKQRKYYHQMLKDMSLKGIPTSIKRKIIEAMKDVLGEDGPELNDRPSTEGSYIHYTRSSKNTRNYVDDEQDIKSSGLMG